MRKYFWVSRAIIYVVGLMLLQMLSGGGRVEAGEERSTLWEKTVKAAKKEGRLVFYGSTSYDLVFAEFQKKYPEIKVSSVVGTARHYTARMMTERRAGKYLPDLYINGASSGYRLYKAHTLDPIKPALILQEVLDQSKWFEGRHEYKDDEGKYVFSFNAELQPYFSYNTKLVDPREIRSFWDLLDPKWKGKLVANDPTQPGGYSAIRFLYYHPELGPNYLRRLLSEMDIAVSRDKVQLVNWLARGKYAMVLFSDAQRLDIPIAKKQGLPVDWFGPKTFKEGAIMGAATGVMGLINKAPHPNAARVAINWLLSREGQILYQKVWAKADSRRIDIPKDVVPEFSRRRKGIKYVSTDIPKWMDMRDINKFIKGVWKRKR